MTARLVTDPNLAPIAFDGADAASFLHNQLSTDVEGMPVGSASWTSYNSPKGRMLASPLLWRRGPQAFVAFVPGDLAEALRKRLSMFVLRAKVAVSGPRRRPCRTGRRRSRRPDGRGTRRNAAFVALPGRPLPGPGARGGRRQRPRENRCAKRPRRQTGTGSAFARASPQITRATQDLFVPQTANFDLVGGINFRKGCYPGQEIVARMQYLGRLKERLFAFHVDGPPPEPGTKVFGADPHARRAAPSSMPRLRPQAAAIFSPWCRGVRWTVAANCASVRPTARCSRAQPLPYAVPAPTAPTRVKTVVAIATHYYVWYRVAGDAGEARTAIDALLHDVFATAGIAGRVLIRRDDPRTWMEVYENVADAKSFETKLAVAEQRRDVGRFTDGKRHVEPFVAHF